MSTRDNQRWLQSWRNEDIDFHQLSVNPLLEQFWHDGENQCKGIVFVPLCGKSFDMLWLSQQGFRVVGVELSPVAVKAFFEESGLPVKRIRHEHFTEWMSGSIRIFCGDFFSLSASDLGHIDTVYDRAALTALPADLRVRYVSFLRQLIPITADIFLLTTEDVSFTENLNVIDDEISELYSTQFDIELTHAEYSTDLRESCDAEVTMSKLYEMVPRN